MLVIVAGDSVGCQGHFGSNLGQCVMNLRQREFSALRASVSVPRVLFNMLEIWDNVFVWSLGQCVECLD